MVEYNLHQINSLHNRNHNKKYVLHNRRKQSTDYISNKPQQIIDASMKKAMQKAKNIYLSKTAIPLYIYATIGIAMALYELQYPFTNPAIHLNLLNNRNCNRWHYKK